MERRSEDLGKQRAKRRSLIYGAGAAGRQLAAALAASRWADMVGYVDDDPALVGHALNGKRIYAPVSYTHLDVYKRQGSGCADLCGESLIAPAGGEASAVRVRRRRHLRRCAFG